MAFQNLRTILSILILALVTSYCPAQLIDFTYDTIALQPAQNRVNTIRAVGDQVLFSVNIGENKKVYSSYGITTSTQEIEGLDGDYFFKSVFGNFGNKYYLDQLTSSSLLTEYDALSGAVRLIGETTDGRFNDRFKVFMGNRIYTLISGQNENNEPLIELLEIDPMADTAVVVFSEVNLRGNTLSQPNIATDGERVYFTGYDETNQFVFSYDPIARSTINLGSAGGETPDRYFLTSGTRVILRTLTADNQQAFAEITPIGIGRSIEASGIPLAARSVGKNYTLISNFDGYLQSYNAVLGRTFRLDFPHAFSNYASFGDNEIATAEYLGDSIVQFSVTNGSQRGTRVVGQVKASPGNRDRLNIEKVANLNGILVAITDHFEALLLDPVAGQSTVVLLNITTGRAHYAVAGGKLFMANGDVSNEDRVFVLSARPSQYLTGLVFDDLNNDGARQPQEGGVSGVRVTDGTGQISYTNDAGNFAFRATPGANYVISADIPNDGVCYEEDTPGLQFEVIFTPENAANLAFPVQRIDGNPAAKTFATISRPRCNAKATIWLDVKNTGCTDLSASSEVTLPEGITFDSADPEPTEINGQLLRFDTDSLGAGSSNQIRIVVKLPNEDRTGEAINLAFVTDLNSSLGMTIRDTASIQDTLRCAYDPNDKQVSPSRMEPSNSNYTQLDETLTYTIRFQNTGNDTAYTVRLADQLSTNLDWSTFKPTSASHSFTATLSKDGAVEFLFENIFLPDSTTNQLASQGFVKFQVQAKPGLDDFSTADNAVAIYFDSNRPIITNTVTSTFVEALNADSDGFNFYEDCNDTDATISPNANEVAGNDIDENCDGFIEPVSTVSQLPGNLVMYPNPSHGRVWLRYDRQTELSATVYAASTGQVISSGVLVGEHQLDLSNVPAGSYLVRIADLATGEFGTFWLQRD